MFSSMLAMASGTRKSEQSEKHKPNEQQPNDTKSNANAGIVKANVGKVAAPTTLKSVPALGSAKPHPSKQETSAENRFPRKILRPTNPRATGLTRDKTTSSSPSVGASGRRAPSAVPASKQDSSSKKLSFKELMKKANNVDGTRITVNVPTRKSDKTSKLVEASSSSSGSKQLSQPASMKSASALKAAPALKATPPSAVSRSLKPAMPQRRERPATSKASGTGLHASEVRRTIARSPLPAARPSAALQRKLEQKRKEKDEDYDSDLDDFVARSDEEEEPSYRDEIKKIFGNRSRRWNEDDEESDLSDMEATGAEIFEEERRSQHIGRLEDAAEERRLAELAERKKRRKAH